MDTMDSIQFSLVSCQSFDSTGMKQLQWWRENRPVSYYEFEFYTDDSQGGIRLDGVFYPARKGYCCMAKPGQNMSEATPRKCCYINIRTQDPMLQETFDRLPTYFSVWNMDEVIACLHKIIALQMETGVDSAIRIQGYVCQVITTLLAYREGKDPERNSLRRHENLLLGVDEYIRENLDQPLTLEHLAKFCNLDPTYFHKLFKATVGRTPAKQILRYRITAAKRALLDSRLRLEEVAHKCGFSSASYFCCKFKEATGMTPMQYRNFVIKTTDKN